MKTATEIQSIFDSLNAKRTAWIDTQMAIQPAERYEYAIKYDTTIAPITTNWEELEMIGIDPATASLYEIIDGLAIWGIYLTSTNHLTDAQLLVNLKTNILRDKITLIAPNPDMSEFIDCNPRGIKLDAADRDANLPRPKNTTKPEMHLADNGTITVVVDGWNIADTSPENN